jgi:general stress protein 13
MNSINVGNIVKGQITGVTPYGVFVSLEDDYSGLVHISEVSDKFVKDLPMLFNIGDIINVKILEIDEDKREVKLSIKKIDYKVEESLSRIPETGSGFGLLEKNLGKWTASKLKEITKNKKMMKKIVKCVDIIKK